MIQFKADHLQVKYVNVKQVSTIAGKGRVKLGVLHKKVWQFKTIDVPYSVARVFIKLKQNHFFVPVPAAMTFYDGTAIAMELYPFDYDDNGKVIKKVSNSDWTSNSEMNLPLISKLTELGTWFIDGKYVFQIQNDEVPTLLHSKDAFVSSPVMSIKISNLHSKELLQARNNSSLAFMYENKMVWTGPIWEKWLDNAYAMLPDGEHLFDTIDNDKFVSLAFSLRAGKIVSNVFGFGYLEPLQLHKAMLQLKTTNIAQLGTHITKLINGNIPFTHTLAWLLGLLSQTESLSDFMEIRALIRHLLYKGTQDIESITADGIFHADSDITSFDEIPLLNVDELMQTQKELLQAA